MTRNRPSKRDQILSAATERFGRDGYENTKWADIAADVGVGPTALYHYFESKQHCLYVIMGQTIESFRTRFEALTAGQSDPLAALLAVMEDCFDISPHDVMRLRVAVAEQGRLGIRRSSPREDETREFARARARELRLAWAMFLAHAMEVGEIPRDDPRLLARAILGLYSSIWEWYRPNGVVPLARVADFFIDRVLALIGLTPEAARGAPDDGMSFLERYLGALDGPDRFSSLEMVADDVEFSIQWATPDGRSRQLVGGRADLRRFVEADDMQGWAHYILACAADGNVEFAVGETRYDDGRRISTFAVTVELDEHDRMRRYMVARSPAITFRSDDRDDG